MKSVIEITVASQTAGMMANERSDDHGIFRGRLRFLDDCGREGWVWDWQA